MNWLKWTWALSAVLTVTSACGPVLIRQMRARGEIAASLDLPAFRVQVAPKSVADVSHYVFELVSIAAPTVPVFSFQTIATTCRFGTVPDGTYKLRAEAFNASSVSVTQGGPIVGGNWATVAAGSVTYSAGTSLAATIQLLHGTGESLANGVTVLNGNPWTGAPVGAP